jgi:hypothetical protein
MSRLEHLVSKVREAMAHGGPGPLSTGEALAAALVLNRADWLQTMEYTIAEALDRIDPDWIPMIPKAAKMVAQADAVMAAAQETARQTGALQELASGQDTVHVTAKLVTFGHAPGYRDASLVFDLKRIGAQPAPVLRVDLSIQPEDAESIVGHLLEVHRWAWDRGAPIDVKPGEARPRWLDAP